MRALIPLARALAGYLRLPWLELACEFETCPLVLPQIVRFGLGILRQRLLPRLLPLGGRFH